MSKAPPHPRHAPARARGSVYVAVLAIASLVLVLGLGGVASARSIARARNLGRDASAARWYCLSAIETGRYMIESDPAWRTNRSNGAWLSNIPMGAGSVSLTVVNPSGALNRSTFDPVVLTATATQGSASRSISVTLAPSTMPLTCLDSPLVSGGSMSFSFCSADSFGATIASNNSITALFCTVNADAEATGSITGLTITGKKTSGAPARTLPDASLFPTYRAIATTIPISSITLSGSTRIITRRLITPASNPFSGGTNAQGVYLIDCAGANITISDSRIAGTLIILNPGSSSSVQNSMCWEPAVANYPILLVNGNFDIKTNQSKLAEGSGFNANPPGNPYPWIGGTADSDTSDSYPSSLAGLVYIDGKCTISNAPSIDTLIISGTFTQSSGSLYLNYNSVYKRSPPPGFTGAGMTPVPGSWTQIVY